MTDELTFTELTGRYRRELQAHCRRMLGSYEDPEDLVQETFLRAWQRRSTFRGDSSFRAWLYRIATNACLDAIQRRGRRVPVADEDEARALLEGIRATEAEPDEAAVSNETVELAFMVAIQHLPDKQRAALILCGVLGWPARDAAALIDTSVPSVNSALQRARRTVRDRLAAPRLEWRLGWRQSEQERELLRHYLHAIERGDAEAFVRDTERE